MRSKHASKQRLTLPGLLARMLTVNMTLGVIVITLMTTTSPGGASPHIAYLQEPTAVPSGGVRYDNYPHPHSRGALAYSIADRWDRTDLTYYVHNCPSAIPCDAAYHAIDTAFQSWSELSPLTFTEVSDPADADIEMGWSNQGPELGYVGDVLAYATFPSDGGDVWFDDAEPWGVFDGSEFDLYLVATHEIGHALGLAHSSVPSALMYPVLTRNTTGLTQDDADAIQALYGLPDRDDVPTQNIPPSGDVETASGQITADFPYEIWEFEAFAGETLTITMTATGGDLEPYLGILTDDEETVLAEAGANGGDTAQVTYRFDRDGTYVIVATREGVQNGFTTGTYTLTIAAADASAAPPPQSEGTILVDIRSYTPVDICELYISPTSASTWGGNWLSSVLTNGNAVELYLSPDTYDIQVVGCDGITLEAQGVNITGDMALEIYEDGINPYVYGT
jgi:hypothetical protein